MGGRLKTATPVLGLTIRRSFLLFQADVELLVPPKREILVYAPLSKHQADLYQKVADKTIMKMVVAKKVSRISF